MSDRVLASNGKQAEKKSPDKVMEKTKEKGGRGR